MKFETNEGIKIRAIPQVNRYQTEYINKMVEILKESTEGRKTKKEACYRRPRAYGSRAF
ncbi:MAG: hypothetical protein JSS09_00825 [Verrucomicrobia bacterium]|nr:hypothetical protein [Verrucomicrobiota bacterium]